MRQAESVAKLLNNVIYYLNLLGCIILFIVGICLLPRTEWESGIACIVIAIFYILFTIFFRNVVNIIIDISEKLDVLPLELQAIRKSVDDCAREYENNKIKQPDSVGNTSDNSNVVFEPKYNDSLDNSILEAIIKGNEVRARYTLMQKKGLSLNAAIEYINKIKADI